MSQVVVMNPQPQTQTLPQRSRSGCGCLYWGCLVVVVLMLLAVGCLYVGYRFTTAKIQEYIQTYTADKPADLPTVEMPEAELRPLEQRVEAFRKRLQDPPQADESGELTDEERTLELTADELNALFQADKSVRGRFYVSLEDNQIKAQISLPLADLNVQPLKDRFLNGEARVEVRVEDGELQVRLRDIRVKGQPLPEWLRQPLEQQDFVAAHKQQQPGPPPARKLERFEVRDGRLIVVLRKEPLRPRTPPESPFEEMPESQPEQPEPDAKPADEAPPQPAAEPAREP